MYLIAFPDIAFNSVTFKTNVRVKWYIRVKTLRTGTVKKINEKGLKLGMTLSS